jgi:hypothetical protein
MRRGKGSDKQLVDRAVTALIALADAGETRVEIRKVMGWLGVIWQEPEDQPAVPPPGADPLTGCRPVTARPQ